MSDSPETVALNLCQKRLGQHVRKRFIESHISVRSFSLPCYAGYLRHNRCRHTRRRPAKKSYVKSVPAQRPHQKRAKRLLSLSTA